MTRFVIVMGGVLSGLGKGVVSASIGKLLKARGFSVTAIKIDPYINIDAGTLRPTEHGEVYVTEDGGEIDQDLGNYERFLDTHLPKTNNITTGQIYKTVIERERRLEYDGRDVEVIPDITNEIQSRIIGAAKGYDFCVVEVGGTTGDVENLLFLHAVRELGKKFDSIYIMVTYLPFLKNVGELKTKPTQHAVARLREVGIIPNFIVTRSESKVDGPRKWIIAQRCFVKEEDVIDNPDVESIYEVPLLFESQGFGQEIMKHFKLKERKPDLEDWKKFVNVLKNSERKVKIGVVGKYVQSGSGEHADVYLSILEAAKHAAAYCGVKPIIKQIQSTDIEENGPDCLSDFDCIIVTPGFGKTGTEGMITTAEYCRENNVPYLGICYGMQIALIEFARNVLGIESANSTEMHCDPSVAVIDFLAEQRELMKKLDYGGTMRLGAYPAKLKKGTKIHALYGKENISERHRHRYEVNPKFIPQFESKGVIFSGVSPDRQLMEFMELRDHKYFVGTQAHPEYKSRPLKPSPLFVGLIKAALQH